MEVFAALLEVEEGEEAVEAVVRMAGRVREEGWRDGGMEEGLREEGDRCAGRGRRWC